MKLIPTIVTGTLALIGGFALVVVADREGWLRADDAVATDPAPPKLQPFAIKPAARQPEAKVVLASNVTAISALPRSQREPSLECTNAGMAVVFDDAIIADAAGLRWQPVQRSAVTHMIEGNVEIDFNGERLAHVSSRAPGVVQKVLKQAGDRVAAGDALALIDSTDLGGAKAALLQANALVRMWSDNLSRMQSLAAGAVTQQELMQAETSLTEARIDQSRASQHLRNLGLQAAAIDAVLAENDTSSTLPVVAPFEGVIIERHAVQGEVIDTQSPLFMIADTSSMWATLDVRESDIRSVKVGQRVLVTLSALPGETCTGTIDWTSVTVDETTRTLKARASLDNAAGLLRANMFGKAQIVDLDATEHLIIPREAVQWDGCCNLVFVRQTDAIFQPFKVRLGANLGDHYVVLDGLRDGDEVVTDGAFLLKTQLLKSSIGAGCCEAGGMKKE